MELCVATRTVEKVRPLTLVDVVEELRREFERVQDELHEARSEIKRLNQKLGRLQPLSRAVSDIDIESLRRKVASYCHPDRGGDGEVMRSINMLLDLF